MLGSGLPVSLKLADRPYHYLPQEELQIPHAYLQYLCPDANLQFNNSPYTDSLLMHCSYSVLCCFTSLVLVHQTCRHY